MIARPRRHGGGGSSAWRFVRADLDHGIPAASDSADVVHVWALVVRGTGPMTSGNRQRTATNWDDGHIHFFTPTDLTWLARAAGFSEVGTRALIATDGGFRTLRRLLDRWSGVALVKNYLSGNSMLWAIK